MKKNVLFMVAALLLCGAVSAQNWGTPDAHAKSSNTPIVARVTVDGNAVTPTADYRLGAFVGEELRGLAAPHDNNFWIQVFYNEGTSEDISFKLYDGTDEFTTCNVTKATQEAGWGTPNEPVVLDFVTTITQSTTMNDGWSWWSASFELGSDGLSLLENSLGTSGVRIQSKGDGYTDRFDYNGNSYWYGSLQSKTIYNEQMYKVRNNGTCTSIISGIPAIPSSHPITINSGTNWIGFPFNQNVSVSVALSGFTPEANDQIKSKNNGFTTYVVYGSTAMWYGSLNTLQPGQGYIYKSNSNETKTLVFQTSREELVHSNITAEGNTFLPNEKDYNDNMTLTAVVELDGIELRDESYEVAAFVGDECRGSIKLNYVEPLDRYIAFLLIAGDADESMRFVLTNGRETSWSSDYLMYSTDAIVGTPTEPTVLHFDPLCLNDESVNLVNVYPNPSNGIINVDGIGINKVEIINTFGQVIFAKETKEDNLQIDLSGYAFGCYLLRVITDNGITTKQLIKN